MHLYNRATCPECGTEIPLKKHLFTERSNYECPECHSALKQDSNILWFLQILLLPISLVFFSYFLKDYNALWLFPFIFVVSLIFVIKLFFGFGIDKDQTYMNRNWPNS